MDDLHTLNVTGTSETVAGSLHREVSHPRKCSWGNLEVPVT